MHIKLPNNLSKYLLAMSGGVDSSVLFHLLLKKNINFDVAHANFNLRGKDSEEDEKFVENLCYKHNIKFHNKLLNVKKYKENNNASTQIAARELRYEWFEKLISDYNYDYLLTAHHLDDSIETFFINLLRGTGISGLLGIKNQKNIHRPLLEYSKKQIIDFAEKNNIKWREDISNESDLYIRNNIRHNVTPTLLEINPNFYDSFKKTVINLKNDEYIIDKYIDKITNEISFSKEDSKYYDINKLNNHIHILYHLFSPYGFNHENEIFKLMNATNSAEISSDRYRLIKDRSFLILTLKKHTQNSYEIKELNTDNLPIKLILSKENSKNSIQNSEYVYFDFNKIKFPLSLRKQKMGDFFHPYGMKGKSKKVSKYFKDIKLSKLDKENTWLLCDANDDILWIVGYRTDERFTPNKTTTTWLKVKN